VQYQLDIFLRYTGVVPSTEAAKATATTALEVEKAWQLILVFAPVMILR